MHAWLVTTHAGAPVETARLQLHPAGRNAGARVRSPEGTPADVEGRPRGCPTEPGPLRLPDGLYLALRRRSPHRTRQAAGLHAGAGAPARPRLYRMRRRPRQRRPHLRRRHRPQPPAAPALGSRLRTAAAQDPARKTGSHRPARLRRGRRRPAGLQPRAAAGHAGRRRLAQHGRQPDPPAAHAGRRRPAPARGLAGTPGRHAGAAPVLQPAQQLAGPRRPPPAVPRRRRWPSPTCASTCPLR